MRVLRYDVHLDEHVHRAGTAESDLPEGVEIPNPMAWFDPDEEPVLVRVEEAPSQVSPAVEELDQAVVVLDEDVDDAEDDLDPDDDQGEPPITGTIPNRAGPGSGKAAWLSYAQVHQVEVDPEANREEIIAALSRAGVPIE